MIQQACNQIGRLREAAVNIYGGNTLARGSTAVDDEPLRHPSSELLLQQNGDRGRTVSGRKEKGGSRKWIWAKSGSSQAGASGGHVLRMTRHLWTEVRRKCGGEKDCAAFGAPFLNTSIGCLIKHVKAAATAASTPTRPRLARSSAAMVGHVQPWLVFKWGKVSYPFSRDAVEFRLNTGIPACPGFVWLWLGL